MLLPPVPKRLDNINGYRWKCSLKVGGQSLVFILYFKAYGAHFIPTQQKDFCALWLPFVAQCQLRTTPLKGFIYVHWAKTLPLLKTNL